MTKPLQIITLEHQKIHEGEHFTLSGYTTLGNGEVVRIGFNPGNKTAHVTFEVKTSDLTHFNLYEDSDYHGGSADLLISNNNRTSKKTPSSTLRLDPHINSSGTVIFQNSIGTPGFISTDGFLDRDHEFVLKRKTQYLFEVESQAAGNTISYSGSWYEV